MSHLQPARILERSVAVTVSNAAVFAVVVVVTGLPIAATVAALWVRKAVAPSGIPPDWLVLGYLQALTMPVAVGALVHGTATALDGDAVRVGACLRAGLARWAAVSWTGLIQTVAVVAASLSSSCRGSSSSRRSTPPCRSRCSTATVARSAAPSR